MEQAAGPDETLRAAGRVLRARLRATSGLDFVCYGLVLACCLLAAGARPGWDRLEPAVGVGAAFWIERTGLDPWGRGWRVQKGALGYSVGPDGVDQRGRGDDVFVPPLDWRVRAYARTEWLWIAALVLLAAWELGGAAFRRVRGPRGRLEAEVLTAGLVGGPLGGVAGLGAWWVLTATPAASLGRSLGEALVIPLPLACVGSGALLGVVGVLGYRLKPTPDGLPDPGSV